MATTPSAAGPIPKVVGFSSTTEPVFSMVHRLKISCDSGSFLHLVGGLACPESEDVLATLKGLVGRPTAPRVSEAERLRLAERARRRSIYTRTWTRRLSTLIGSASAA